ncbi:glycosyltransferase family 2 protein [Kocuria marina]|uniref:glycosyltransferase n=1 Tax=Kocuria marina TaxID=223184 RepID=UPI002989DAE8|nr:glycosyltransferase family 2 protein [Kocuria marina]MCT1724257.1 glycosyltransferase family 2 protein [Kocuria marina]MCT1733792.1 glycosyltransferase family 2 protein [Kocuria marina]
MIRRIAVIIPACNEEDRVGRCLESVAGAIAGLGHDPSFARSEWASADDVAGPAPGTSRIDAMPPLRGAPRAVGTGDVEVTVVLAADGCTDRTVERARQAWAVSNRDGGRARLEIVSGQWHSAGGARAAAARQALAASDPEWIASTDADTMVPENWLRYQVQRAGAGVDAILGTVEPDPTECPPHVYELWQREHTLVESHPHIHAANMGVRASFYEHTGGFPPLACSEDEALLAALHQVGARVEATDRIRAVTSGRLEGRAELGFAHHLRTLSLPREESEWRAPASPIAKTLEGPPSPVANVETISIVNQEVCHE